MPTIEELKAKAEAAAKEFDDFMRAEAAKAAAGAPRVAQNILHDLLLEIANQFHNHPKIEALVKEYVDATTPPAPAEPEKKA